MKRIHLVILGVLVAPVMAHAQSSPAVAAAPDGGVGSAVSSGPGNLPLEELAVTTLDALHRKGLITDEEYAARLRDLIELGDRARNENTLVVGRMVSTTVYGFAQGDAILDSTRSFVDLAGMAPIAQPNTDSGALGRLMLSARNSRLGFLLAAPSVEGIRPRARLEFDLLGNQPGTIPYDNGYKESAYFNSPTVRVRHAVLYLDTDVVNVWFGQTWELVGWQGTYFPSSVSDQGLPGELYARTAQLRLDRTFHFGALGLEAAVAALKPPQIDSEAPDLQVGLKFTDDAFRGVQTIGQVGTGVEPASLGISAGRRHYRLPTNASADSNTQSVEGNILAADLMIPVIPATTRKSWAMTVVAEGQIGSGMADEYVNLTGGAGVGSPPGVSSSAYAKVADVDPGLVGWSNATGQLETVDWRVLLLSGQLYLPPEGRLWISGTWSDALSDNIGEMGPRGTVFTQETWGDV